MMSGAMRHRGKIMTMFKIFCEECNTGYLLDSSDTEEPPIFCPYCSSEIDEHLMKPIDSAAPTFDDDGRWDDLWESSFTGSQEEDD